MWQHMFSMPVMRTVWRRELEKKNWFAHYNTEYVYDVKIYMLIMSHNGMDSVKFLPLPGTKLWSSKSQKVILL